MKSRKFSAFIRPVGIVCICMVLILAAGLTGCKMSSLSKQEPAVTPPALNESEGKTDLNNNDVENNDKKDEVPPPPAVVYYNALTGLETTSELAALRPVAICIENSTYSLPQYGLSDAQILIEVPTANGGTKLMMLTTNYRYMTTIGALTSTRPYLAEMSQMFDAIHCFNGSDGTLSDEELAVYDNLNAQNALLNGIYYTDATRFDKDDLMTNGILIDSGIRRAELNETSVGNYVPYQFISTDKKPVSSDTRAIEATIRYSDDTNAVFTYDTESGTYKRSQFGETTLDGTNGNAVSYKNLFIMYASSTTYESQNNKSLDFVFSDGGTGTYLTDGQAVSFNWSVDENGNLHFTDMTGNVLEVNRGNSYIGVMPVGNADQVYIK